MRLGTLKITENFEFPSFCNLSPILKQARKRVNRRLNLLIMMTAVGSLWLKVSHTSAHDLEESAKSYLTEIG